MFTLMYQKDSWTEKTTFRILHILINIALRDISTEKNKCSKHALEYWDHS